MSQFPTTHELKAVREASETAAKEALFKCATLEAKNKEAAKAHILQIQLLLARRNTK